VADLRALDPVCFEELARHATVDSAEEDDLSQSSLTECFTLGEELADSNGSRYQVQDLPAKREVENRCPNGESAQNLSYKPVQH